jgi:hypothetical protein
VKSIREEELIDFITDRCAVEPGVKVRVRDLFRAWKVHQLVAGLREPGTQKQFVALVRRHFARDGRIGYVMPQNVGHFYGLRPKEK